MAIKIDLNAIQKIKALETPDMPNVFKQIVEIFAEATPGDLAQMKALSADKAAKLAHKLKSSCASLGVIEMAELCAKIEANATKMNTAELQSSIQDLEQMYHAAKEELVKLV